MSLMATRTALGNLIHTARAPENLSLQDIADRASRHGVKISKQTISRLASEDLDSINLDNIRGLAIGLGISERRVAAAALETMGVDLGVDEVPLRQAILDTDLVGESTKRNLLSIIENDQAVAELRAARGNKIDFGWAPVEMDGLAEAARKPPPGGSKGRQARRAQDEAETGSQDPGGLGGDE